MRVAAGMLVTVIAAMAYPSSAQYPPRGPYPQQEQCPQGRQLRQQKYFPPQMTDCQVLDADTAERNQRIHARPEAAPAQARPAPDPPQAAYVPQPAPMQQAPAPVQPANAAPVAIQRMIDREMALNDTCRGSTSGYEQACKDRDALVTQLRDFGWCYGTPEQLGYQKQWQLCSAPPPKFAEPARPQSPAQQPTTPASPSIVLVAPLEPDAVIFDNIKGNNDALNAMVNLVRLNDFRCDTISSAKAWLMSKGFTLKCNRFSYTYEIADKGGHWIVTVQ